jgi:hypothetical protein
MAIQSFHNQTVTVYELVESLFLRSAQEHTVHLVPDTAV